MTTEVEMDGGVQGAEDALLDAMRRSDVVVLQQLLADDLVFVAPDGSRVDKSTDLEAHRSGATRFEQIEVLTSDIDEHDGTAVAVVVVDVVVVDHGQRIRGTLRYSRQWRSVDGRWQVIAGSVAPVEADTLRSEARANHPA